MTADMTLDAARDAFEAQPNAETAPYRAAGRIRIVCANCGSDACGRGAEARWNEAAQAWDVVGVYDSSWCDDCGEDNPGLNEVLTCNQGDGH